MENGIKQVDIMYDPVTDSFSSPVNPLDVQSGGSHYKNRVIQPIEYIAANKLNFCEGSIVKYITRWREKNGVEDLNKIKHYIDLLIFLEEKYK